MKISKTDYLKNCWDYVTSTLKYLKDMTGNMVLDKSRMSTFEEIGNVLKDIALAESVTLDEGTFYELKRYNDEILVGKFIGNYYEDSFSYRFEVLYSDKDKFSYQDITDFIGISIRDLEPTGSVKVKSIVISPEDLALYIGKPKTGKLLQKMIAEYKSKSK